METIAALRNRRDTRTYTDQLVPDDLVRRLGSCPVTIHHPEIARSVLDIPESVDPSMIVTLGWPQPGEKLGDLRMIGTLYIFRSATATLAGWCLPFVSWPSSSPAPCLPLPAARATRRA
jgi:hypothetical protein